MAKKVVTSDSLSDLDVENVILNSFTAFVEETIKQRSLNNYCFTLIYNDDKYDIITNVSRFRIEDNFLTRLSLFDLYNKTKIDCFTKDYTKIISKYSNKLSNDEKKEILSLLMRPIKSNVLKGSNYEFDFDRVDAILSSHKFGNRLCSKLFELVEEYKRELNYLNFNSYDNFFVMSSYR